MLELIKIQKGMMSSKQIAESTGKEHFHVLRDIKEMLQVLKIDDTNLVYPDYQVVKDNRNYTAEILINERLSICLAGGYSVVLRMAIIDDWAKMKAKDFMPTNFLESLKLLVIKEEENERLLLTVDNLSTALDTLVEWVSIIKVSRLNKIHESTFNWRLLKRKSEEMGFLIKKSESPRFGFQNLYHVNSFKACYPQFNYKFLNE